MRVCFLFGAKGPPPQGEDNLSIEPAVNDNTLLFVDFAAYDATVGAPRLGDRHANTQYLAAFY